MNKNAEIVIIEDDVDDRLILSDIFDELNYANEVLFFENGILALEYLNRPEVHPFLILSDLNLPLINGFEIRKRIFENKQISSKCIPYLFFTTSVQQKAVIDAYSLSVQGFLVKPITIKELKDTIQTIIAYWKCCFAPNNL